jgi:hypothetical protein
MRVVVHHYDAINEAVEVALLSERLHHRTNDPPYLPAPYEIDVEQVLLRTAIDFNSAVHRYGDSLARLWAKGEPFINLEGDTAPWPGALTQMWKCPEPWCVLPYLIHQVINANGIGCVKFSAEFIASCPDVWRNYPRNDVFDWRSLDAWLLHTVEPRRPHIHFPPALHMNRVHL